jgi:hypothetical protein
MKGKFSDLFLKRSIWVWLRLSFRKGSKGAQKESKKLATMECPALQLQAERIPSLDRQRNPVRMHHDSESESENETE